MVLTGRTVVAHQLILSGQTHDVLFISFSIFYVLLFTGILTPIMNEKNEQY